MILPAIVTGTLAIDPAMDDISRKAFDYFWQQSPAPLFLTRDRAPNSNVPTPTWVPASIAATGYSLAALAVGADRGWVKREDALNRARATAQALANRTQHYKGWFYHFIKTADGTREWSSEASSIDTSLLLNGLMIAEAYFNDPTLNIYANQIYQRIDWKAMLTDGGTKPNSTSFSHGYKPESGYITYRWDRFSELKHLYLVAFALWPSCPQKAWDNWNRTIGTYQGIELIDGGPLFMHQMAYGFYNFTGQRDRLGYDYWVESRNATLAQRKFCTINPGGYVGYGPNIWGLSACDNPSGYNANGAPLWITDNGTLAPVAAAASYPFTPIESVDAVKEFKKRYPQSYGRYGFATGINPTQNWTSPDVIGIDLGQAMLNIENVRNGLPHRLIMNQERVKRAWTKAGFRPTAEGPLTARKLRKL